MSRQCPQGTQPYTIRSGDTIYSLSQRFNISLQSILNANPGVDPDQLRIGQQICLPVQTPPTNCPEGNPYKVLPGDTMFKIAQFFNVSVDDLIEANPMVNPQQLQVGQIICVPLATPPVTCPEGATSYVIKAGDTFYKIAQTYNTSIGVLQRLNPNVNPTALLIGQKICVPAI